MSEDEHIIGVYFPPSARPEELEEEVRDVAGQETGIQAIMGDFNAYNEIWGGPDSKTTPKGRALATTLEQAQLKLIQRTMKGVPTWQRGERRATLDLVVGRGPPQGSTWQRRDNQLGLSDHDIILAEIEVGNQDIRTTKGIDWNFWDEYTEGTEGEAAPENPIDAARWIMAKGVRTKYLCSQSKRWWNQEVEQARKDFRRANRNKDGSQPRREQARGLKRAYNKAIKKAKKECWENFVKSAREGVRGEFYRMVKLLQTPFGSRERGTMPVELWGPNGQTARTDAEKVTLCQTALFPIRAEQLQGRGMQEEA